MFKKHHLAILVSSVLVSTAVIAEQQTVLQEVNVVSEEPFDRMKITKQAIQQKQPRDIKALLADALDVQVNDLQATRSGNDGVNVRGLQGNRVGMTVDGIELPETQENKLFVSLGMDFGRGDSIEPSALRGAQVQYGGSAGGLSGSVNFATLEPNDLIKTDGQVGGFIASGYNSVDNSVYTSLGGAAKNDRYEGLVLATGRFGSETENKGSPATATATRTQANPADYKNHYVLVKNAYQFNPQNRVKLTVEHQQKHKDTDLLSSNGASIDRTTGSQLSGVTYDNSGRTRVSLGHEFTRDSGWLQRVNTQAYFQSAKSENFRKRVSERGDRVESGLVSTKTYGVSSDFMSPIEATVPNVLRYGFSYQYTDFSGDLTCNSCFSGLLFDPFASTKQRKAHLYVEDEMVFGPVTVLPHLGVMNYSSTPSSKGYQQAAGNVVGVKKQSDTIFLPKFSVAWKAQEVVEPYFQYSRGVKLPSAQQLTSSFGNTVMANGRVVRQYAAVGNPNLRPEVADNFELGIKSQNDKLQYRVAAYYNKYRDFIDSISRSEGEYSPLIQYQNLDKAAIHGVTANAKWQFYDALYVSGGLSYAKGKAERQGNKAPINTIQPLKLKTGFGYEGQQFGANVQLNHIKGKKQKDINGTFEANPSRTVNVIDLGLYWKPVKNLTLSANVNNLFDKKYWNWTDISYFALNSSSVPGSLGLDKNNADTYSAPGRHYNLGLRYEF